MNIYEKAKNNFSIEMRVFEHYEEVKHEIIKAIDFLRHGETLMGICRIFYNQNSDFWYRVIKPWFQPERFGITHLWFNVYIGSMGNGELHIISIRGQKWIKIPLISIDFDDKKFGYWFPPYKKYIPHRIKVLKLALKDLERIKGEYDKG